MYDKTRTDTYSISVSQTGGLKIVPTSSNITNDSQDPSTGDFVDFFTGIDTVINSTKGQLHDIDIT
jgi:hypothetical protein